MTEIRALTGIRGLAAMWVVVFHYGDKLASILPAFSLFEPVYNKGHIGVDLFFILSGFIITSVYSRQSHWDAPSKRRFLRRRFARIYPVHLVTLLTLAGLVLAAQALGKSVEGNYGAYEFVIHLLVLHAFPIADSAWNYPSWSISAEFFAYTVIYPICVLLFRRPRPRRHGAELAFFFILILVCLRATSSLEAWTYILSVSLEFAAGSALYQGLHHRPKLAEKLVNALPAVIVVGILICFIPTNVVPGNTIRYILVFLCLFSIGALSVDKGLICRCLSSAPMRYLGRISYSLYMGHALVEKVFKSVLPAEMFADESILVKLIAVSAHLIAPILLAVFLYHVVEEPLRKKIGAGASQPSSKSNARNA